MKFALIPARAGSKGIKNKNLQIVGAMSLVERAIEEAKNANIFDKIYLTTDSSRIAECGVKLGIEILNRRPDLATDDALISDVILDHIQTLSPSLDDQLWLIQPTALFRTNLDFEHVLNAISGICPSDIYGFTVKRVVDSHPARMYRHVSKNWRALIPDQQHYRRQDLDPLFLRDGLFYYSSIAALLKNDGQFFGDQPICVNLNKSYYVNIDSLEDLAYARFIYDEYLK